MTFLASGCSGSSAGKTVTGWFGGSGEAGKKGNRVYYAAVEGLEVRAEASPSSKLVGKLRLHERVARTEEKNGYSLVRARGGSLEGWVLSARLEWRAPRANGTATKATTPAAEGSSGDAAAPVAGDATTDETAGETAEPSAADLAPAEDEAVEAAAPAPTATAPPSPGPAPKKKGMGASVFDPY